MRLATVAIALAAVGSVAAAPIPNSSGYATGAFGLDVALDRRENILTEGARLAEKVTDETPVVGNISQNLDNLDVNKQQLERTASGKEKKHDEEYTSQNFHNGDLGYQRLDKTLSQKEKEVKERKPNWFKKNPIKAMALSTVAGAGVTGGAVAIGMDQKNRSDMRDMQRKNHNLEDAVKAYVADVQNRVTTYRNQVQGQADELQKSYEAAMKDYYEKGGAPGYPLQMPGQAPNKNAQAYGMVSSDLAPAGQKKVEAGMGMVSFSNPSSTGTAAGTNAKSQ